MPDSCLYLGGGFTTPSPYVVRYCLGRDPPFEAVPGAHELGPVAVMAAGIAGLRNAMLHWRLPPFVIKFDVATESMRQQ